MTNTLLSFDLNADLGEGSMHEQDMMPYISSANIACGGHTGDVSTMRESLRLCEIHGVAAGAHPSFPDREGFGRRPMDLSPLEVTAVVREQIEALKEVAARIGVSVRHVKPHGMLYNMAVKDAALSVAIARAVAASGIRVYFGLAGASSVMLYEAAKLGLTVVGEGFADRGYAPDGSLWPRGQAGSLLFGDEALAQGLDIALRGQARAVTGEIVNIPAQTLCLHGDSIDAAELTQRLRSGLEQSGVHVMPPQVQS